MFNLFRRFHRMIIMVSLAAGLTACLPFLPPLPTSNGSTPTSAALEDITLFVTQLQQALSNRDYTQLQQMMGTPFTIGNWRSEGISLPPGVAIAQLRNSYLPPQAMLNFPPDPDWATLLEGSDPLTLWGPEVQAVETIYVTGLSNSGQDQAILVVAQRSDGALYWHGMLLAAGGFAAQSPAATPTDDATAPASQATVLPTNIQFVRVLQNINVRSGPGTQYGRVGYANRGELLEVFGISSNSQWWNVLCPNGTVTCWVSADPILTRPTNSPAPQPTNTPVPPPIGQAPVRIRFAPGATSATLHGVISFPKRADYLVRALVGQEMTVQVASPGSVVNFAITGANDGQPYKRIVNEDRIFTFSLPSTQDYRISVQTLEGGPSEYDLFVSVLNAAPPPPTPTSAAPERIRFAPGASAASVNGTVTFPSQKQYVLRALAGQEMTVEILSVGDVANFGITGVDDGVPYKRLVNEDRQFSFSLPRTQDYLINVAVPEGSRGYALTVAVVNAPEPPPAAEPIRIRFQPGAISEEISSHLPAGGVQNFILQARAGQTMTVEVFTPADNVLLGISGVSDGIPYKRTAVAGSNFSFVLPLTQDYLVTLESAGGGANYTLVVTIQ